ncbi:MAG: hypothetical protein R3F61_06705 [Myxococcota bacterium]
MLILLLSCAVDDGRIPLQYCEDPGLAREVSPVERPLTWHADVAPIVTERCARCHESAVAPFPLKAYDDVASRAGVIEGTLLTGAMPQWSADDCCGKAYRDDRSLTQEELDTVVGWLRQGAPEGDPSTAVSLPSLARPELPRVDAVAQMAEPYTPSPPADSTDDLRCFVIDIPEAAKGRYVTGFDVKPGNLQVVHHVLVSAVARWDQAAFTQLDARDPGPGFECRGGEGALGDRQVGAWVPGLEGLVLPEGLGIELPNDGKLILSLHYDLSAVDGQPTSDQTLVELMLADEVERAVTPLPVMNPLWVFDRGMRIEGDSAETGYGFAWDPQLVYGPGREWDVWGVFVHMHELGTTASVAILRGDEQECLLHIPYWDFDWQANYWFDTPTRLSPGDRLYLECNWRNPYDTLAWGDDQEMCGAIVYGTKAE